jgi:hypothetical protein
MPTTSAAAPLLSSAGQRLFARLVRAFPGHVVLAQVALSRLLAAQVEPEAAEPRAKTIRHLDGVADFVVCRSDFTPLAVVECTGMPSGDEAGGRLRRKDQLLQAAGIKVLRVAAADLPTEGALKALIAVLPVKARSVPLMRHAS